MSPVKTDSEESGVDIRRSASPWPNLPHAGWGGARSRWQLRAGERLKMNPESRTRVSEKTLHVIITLMTLVSDRGHND